MSVQLYDRLNSLDIPIKSFLGSLESHLLLDSMEKYVNGVIIQWNRIQSAKMKISEIVKEEIEIWNTYPILQRSKELTEERNKKWKIVENKKTLTFSILFLGIHFYFICCEKVQNTIKKLAEVESNGDLFVLWVDLKPKFKPYNDARNHLEHIETRTTQKYASDRGNLCDDKYTLGGKEFDISYESLKFICGSYEQVLNTLIK